MEMLDAKTIQNRVRDVLNGTVYEMHGEVRKIKDDFFMLIGNMNNESVTLEDVNRLQQLLAPANVCYFACTYCDIPQHTEMLAMFVAGTNRNHLEIN